MKQKANERTKEKLNKRIQWDGRAERIGRERERWRESETESMLMMKLEKTKNDPISIYI